MNRSFGLGIKLTLKCNQNGNQNINFDIANQICKADPEGVIKINHGNWANLRLNQDYGQILTWGAVGLDLEGNQQSQIVFHIANINFCNLRSLSLKLNRIESLEALVTINAPLLQKIYLDSNQFATIRSIRKCKLTNIKQLSVTGNKIIDLQCIFECNYANLCQLNLEWYFGNQILYSMAPLAKIQSNSLTHLSIQHPQRIVNIIVLAALKRKCENIRYLTFKGNTNGLIRKCEYERIKEK